MFYGTTEYGGTAGYGTIYSLNMGLAPFVALVNNSGPAGQTVEIIGQGFGGTTSVTFNGVPATSFTVVAETYLTAVVPAGAGTGPVVVVTPSARLTSNKNYTVLP